MGLSVVKAYEVDAQTRVKLQIATRSVVREASVEATIDYESLFRFVMNDQFAVGAKQVIVEEGFRVIRAKLAGLAVDSDGDGDDVLRFMATSFHDRSADVDVAGVGVVPVDAFQVVMFRAYYGIRDGEQLPEDIGVAAFVVVQVAAYLTQILQNLDMEVYGRTWPCPIDLQEGEALELDDRGYIGMFPLAKALPPINSVTKPFTVPYGAYPEVVFNKMRIRVAADVYDECDRKHFEIAQQAAIPLCIDQWNQVVSDTGASYESGEQWIAELAAADCVVMLGRGADHDMDVLSHVALYVESSHTFPETDVAGYMAICFDDGYNCIISPVTAWAIDAADKGESVADGVRRAIGDQDVDVDVLLEMFYADLVRLIWWQRGFLGAPQRVIDSAG